MSEYQLIYQLKTGYITAIFPMRVIVGGVDCGMVQQVISHKYPDVPYSIALRGLKVRVHQIARPGNRYRSTQDRYLL